MLSSIVNKKGISEMVSYVLLVVIALGLSVLVYNYLQNYVPKDSPECPEDIAISVNEIFCNPTSKTLTFNYSNKGLFSVDFLYVRMAKENRTIAQNIDNYAIPQALQPSKSGLYQKTGIGYIDSSGQYTLQIEPAVWVDKKLALCEKAMVTQKISCT